MSSVFGADWMKVNGRPITAAHVRELLAQLDAVCPGGLRAPTGGALQVAVTDADGALLTPFRTWRNTNTGRAAERLSAEFGCNIPHRWSVAHLYQAILDALDAAGQLRGPAERSSYARQLVDLATDERATRYGSAFPARATHVIPSETLRGRNPLAVAKAGTGAGAVTGGGAGAARRVAAAARSGTGSDPYASRSATSCSRPCARPCSA